MSCRFPKIIDDDGKLDERLEKIEKHPAFYRFSRSA